MNDDTKVERILYEELEILEEEIIQRHEQAGQVASGKTRAKFLIQSSNLVGTLSGAGYVGVLERGRKPGGVPKDFIEILQKWAASKNISFSSEKQFELWANGVKWKLIREGTKLYRSGQKQDIFDTPIENFNKRLPIRIMNYYESELINDIFNF
ncbi:MAG: hypothetical protein WCG93_12835 [Paludibacter sp.]